MNATRPVEDASRFLTVGKWFMGQEFDGANDVPRPLKQACLYGAGGVLLVSLVGMLNIFSLLTDPPAYFLKVYLALFAVWTIVLEIGIPNEGIQTLREVLLQRCRFFESPAGRGSFYTFMGVLGTSLWASSPLDALAGLYMGVVGFLCAVASRKRVAANERTASAAEIGQNNDMTYFRQDITEV
eukprot:Lankesteria_metandrocarpae@DN5305_c0_g1_i1.p1